MRRARLGTIAALVVAMLGFGARVAGAQPYDGDPSTGEFNPQLAVTDAATLVNRPGDFTIDLTQQDMEDPPVVSTFNVPGAWQIPVDKVRRGQKPDGSGATRCSQTVDGLDNSPDGTGIPPNTDTSKRSDAHFARAEKIGTTVLKAAVDGISRPGEPIEWDGDAGFIYQESPTRTWLCLLLVTKDTRVTSIPDPSPGDSSDDIEGISELVADFPLELTTVGGETVWRVVADLTDLIQNSTVQTLNVTLRELKVVFSGHSAGNWHSKSNGQSSDGIDFAVNPAVSGTYHFTAHFVTCPPSDPSGQWGNCLSDKPPVDYDIPIAIILPPPSITSPAQGAFVSDPTIRGTSDPLATIRLREGETQAGVATADGAGFWAASLDLLDGTHTLTAAVYDAGGESVRTAPRSFTLDRVAPAAPTIEAPLPGETVEARYVEVSGASEAAATVRVFEAGASVGQATADGAGHWSASIGFMNGEHTISAVAVDRALNPSGASAEITFSVDAPIVVSHPFPKVLSPSAYQVLNGATSVDVSWKEDLTGEPVAGYVITVARPFEFSRVFALRVTQSGACDPAEHVCHATLTFPLALSGDDKLPADGKYALGVFTVFKDGHRSNGTCDDGSAFGTTAPPCDAVMTHAPGYDRPPGTTSVLSTAAVPAFEFLISERRWARAYQDDSSHNVLLVDPDSGEFRFVGWRAGQFAQVYGGTATLVPAPSETPVPDAPPTPDATLLAFASPSIVIAAVFDGAEATGTATYPYPPTAHTLFRAQRLP